MELYNPWVTPGGASDPNVTNRPLMSESSGEFYPTKDATTDYMSGVYLTQKSPGASGSPVWRMVVTTSPGSTTNQPLDFDDPTIPPHAVAAVYFTSPSSPGPNDFYATTAAQPLYPGRYAVIGPQGIGGVTTIGRLNPAPSGGNPDTGQDGVTTGISQIVLTPGGMNPVVVQNNGTYPTPPLSGGFQAPVAVVINHAELPFCPGTLMYQIWVVIRVRPVTLAESRCIQRRKINPTCSPLPLVTKSICNGLPILRSCIMGTRTRIVRSTPRRSQWLCSTV